MSSGLRHRLRLVFGAARAAAVDGADAAAELPLIQFVAFTERRRISGHIRLDNDRLSDTLNAHLEYQLCGVLVEDLAAGGSARSDEVVLERDELLAVLTDGPRGDPARRVRTVAHDVTLKAGPYLIRGSLHAAPGSDPLASARRRRPMIPLSDAWIEYRSGEAAMSSVIGTVVVNSATVDWIHVGFAPPSALTGLEPVGVVISNTRSNLGP